jgi:hypothetical protein
MDNTEIIPEMIFILPNLFFMQKGLACPHRQKRKAKKEIKFRRNLPI